jgi:7-keto-8-aminopelargonate synthetase-like enzyme
MDGDQAPLPPLVALKERYGAWLMLDEAHATGLFGHHRRGLAEASGVADRVEVQMGTLGKALGAAGGFISGSRGLIDYLINQARSFIFSTAPAPAAAAAAIAGVRFVQSQAGQARCASLWDRVAQLCPANASPLPHAPAAGPPSQPETAAAYAPAASAILPLILGDDTAALATAARLRDQGLFVPAVRYPTVPRGTARLRITLTATHTADEVERLRAALSSIGLPLAPCGHPHAPARPA